MNISTESKLLTEERKRTTFSVDEMINLLDGGKHKTELRHKIENVILNDPRMKADDISCMSTEQQHVYGVKRMVYFYTDLAKRMKWDFSDANSEELEFLPRTVGLATSLMLHPGAFMPSIANMGTEEQVNKWYPLCKDYSIIGAYAQTELGHGTNLRQLETTATYDPAREEFVLHCPTLSSTKWWPGEIAKNATHALVMARLISGGKSYGMHPFIVQIRDLSSHKPMPGMSIGSIGAIMANGGTDNGYLVLKNVRIPRENMLAKYAEVLPDGTYIKKGNDKLLYASMVNLRVLLTKDEGIVALQKACTIAARYSCVRRQGSLQPGAAEVPVMDYVTQQHKILPQIAASYAFHFTQRHVIAMYRKFLKERDEGNLTNLAELHFVTAGLKASITEQCVDGIETVRRACGGHGYSHASGLPMILARAISSCTYEGENTVMYLQAARYLLKCASKIFSGKPVSGSVGFLAEPVQARCDIFKMEQFLDLNTLLDCFKHRSQVMLTATASSMQDLVSGGMSPMEAWNVCSVQLVEVAKAHMVQYILSSFIDYICDVACSDPARNVLSNLCSLYGLHHINQCTRDFLKDGYLNGEQCDLAQKAEAHLLMTLRQNTVGLVDSFEFDDQVLASCLGAYDGNVYERLFEFAKNSPLNKEEVHSETYKYLRPHLLVGRDKLMKLDKASKL